MDCVRLTAFGMKRKPAVWKINKRTLNRKLLIHLGWNRLQQGLSQREQWLLPLKQHAPHGLDASTELFPDQEDIDLIETLMSEHNLLPRGFIAIGPSASQPLKCWPLLHFTHLTEMLIQSGWKIVLVGGPDEPEPELLEEEFGDKIINLAGRLSPSKLRNCFGMQNTSWQTILPWFILLKQWGPHQRQSSALPSGNSVMLLFLPKANLWKQHCR